MKLVYVELKSNEKITVDCWILRQTIDMDDEKKKTEDH